MTRQSSETIVFLYLYYVIPHIPGQLRVVSLLYGCEAWTISKNNAKVTAGSRDAVFEKDAENLVDEREK